MLITALAMSPAELDRLPPQQRAVFMQLVCNSDPLLLNTFTEYSRSVK